ncbi:MAG: NAD-dependent epimerase/dehydratase family protein, partial [Nitrospirota bacterium]
RPYMTYGPAQDSRKLIPSIILSLLEGNPPQLSRGQWRADWIYIDDVIEGFLAAAHKPNIEGCTLDLGSGTLLAVRAIVKQLVTIMNPSVQPLFGALPDRPLEPQRVANIAESQVRLGWHAATPLEVGLLRTVEWYRVHRKVVSA